ncbi:hypothetical protein TYRP_006118 [Tyrophagus putrescentiae]|nr:hypothetical protein TYRP_006118 [Tyrophagus putrescentiae]
MALFAVNQPSVVSKTPKTPKTLKTEQDRTEQQQQSAIGAVPDQCTADYISPSSSFLFPSNTRALSVSVRFGKEETVMLAAVAAAAVM